MAFLGCYAMFKLVVYIFGLLQFLFVWLQLLLCIPQPTLPGFFHTLLSARINKGHVNVIRLRFSWLARILVRCCLEVGRTRVGGW